MLACDLGVHDFVYQGSPREREDAIFSKDFNRVINAPEKNHVNVPTMAGTIRLRGSLELQGDVGPGNTNGVQAF